MTDKQKPRDETPPTPERLARSLADGNPFRRAQRQTADATGRIGNPWRQMALPERLHAQQRLTDDDLAAAERFARLFRAAHLSGVKLASLEARVSGGGGGEASEWSAIALRDMGRMLDALPGPRLRNLAWDLLGELTPLPDWERQRGVTPGHRLARKIRAETEAAIVTICKLWAGSRRRPASK